MQNHLCQSPGGRGCGWVGLQKRGSDQLGVWQLWKNRNTDRRADRASYNTCSSLGTVYQVHWCTLLALVSLMPLPHYKLKLNYGSCHPSASDRIASGSGTESYLSLGLSGITGSSFSGGTWAGKVQNPSVHSCVVFMCVRLYACVQCVQVLKCLCVHVV